MKRSRTTLFGAIHRQSLRTADLDKDWLPRVSELTDVELQLQIQRLGRLTRDTQNAEKTSLSFSSLSSSSTRQELENELKRLIADIQQTEQQQACDEHSEQGQELKEEHVAQGPLLSRLCNSDIVFHIADFLPMESVARWSRTCRKLRRLLTLRFDRGWSASPYLSQHRQHMVVRLGAPTGTDDPLLKYVQPPPKHRDGQCVCHRYLTLRDLPALVSRVTQLRRLHLHLHPGCIPKVDTKKKRNQKNHNNHINHINHIEWWQETCAQVGKLEQLVVDMDVDTAQHLPLKACVEPLQGCTKLSSLSISLRDCLYRLLHTDGQWLLGDAGTASVSSCLTFSKLRYLRLAGFGTLNAPSLQVTSWLGRLVASAPLLDTLILPVLPMETRRLLRLERVAIANDKGITTAPDWARLLPHTVHLLAAKLSDVLHCSYTFPTIRSLRLDVNKTALQPFIRFSRLFPNVTSLELVRKSDFLVGEGLLHASHLPLDQLRHLTLRFDQPSRTPNLQAAQVVHLLQGVRQQHPRLESFRAGPIRFGCKADLEAFKLMVQANMRLCCRNPVGNPVGNPVFNPLAVNIDARLCDDYDLVV